MSTRAAVTPFHHAVALIAALAMAFAVALPKPAKADRGELIAAGIIGLAIYCGATGNCSGKRTYRSTTTGPRDAIGLSGQTARQVQAGLQNLGFYTGPLDGVVGGGTRTAIRSYQVGIGAPQTGRLAGQQINDLVALSPDYAHFPASDTALFAADLAKDLDREGVRRLQTALNQQGYPAGYADGVAGPQTRSAIARYKTAQGLAGQPLATRRLLARLTGGVPPVPAGRQILEARGVAAPVPASQNAAAVPSGDLTFDILGVELGMTEAQVKAQLMEQLGGELMFDRGDSLRIGARDAPMYGFLVSQAAWPDTSAEQIMAVFDDTRPELGALAIFRLIRMPDGVDQAAFDDHVLPNVLANYGGAGKVRSETRWIGSKAARAAGDAAACGDLRLSVDTNVANALDGLWRSGGGPRLDGGLDTVAADCGEVLSVDYGGAVVRIGLWNSGALAGEGAGSVPQIRF